MNTEINKLIQFIEEYYNCIFTGKLNIKEIEDGYSLELTTNNYMMPLIFSYCGTKDEFIIHCIDYLKNIRLTDINYFKGVKYEKRGSY